MILLGSLVLMPAILRAESPLQRRSFFERSTTPLACWQRFSSAFAVALAGAKLPVSSIGSLAVEHNSALLTGELPRWKPALFCTFSACCQPTRFCFLGVVAKGKPLTSIFVLFLSACPLAVAGGVSLVVVYPFDCVSRRSVAHVRKEIVKRIPAFAYRYSSTAVATICGMVTVVASLSHGCPNWIQRVASGSLGVSVFRFHCGEKK